MTIIEVTNSAIENQFISVPKIINKNDPAWISPPDNDIRSVFDPAKNNFFNHGHSIRWIFKDENGNLAGRIAAFINHSKTNQALQPSGGIGFFDCINDMQAAAVLFDTAKNWLQQRGMQAMEGPVNLGENYKYWGLLVEGFTPPSFGMNYNPSYYQQLFESYGFNKLYDQYTNLLDATVPMPDRFSRIANRVIGNPRYSFKHIEIKSFSKFADDFKEIYNDAWSDFENFVPIDDETIHASFEEMKPIVDEKIIWYAYYDNEPIAFIVCLPDINPVMKYLDGRIDWWGKLKFLWYKNIIKIDRLRIIVMGCKKKFQNHGIESALIHCLQKEVLPRKKIKEVELAWVGDFNPKMIALHTATGAKKHKVHRTYRYIFNDGNSLNRSST